MDYKDWLQKYYPIPASEVQGTDIDRIDHCINKWEGLKDLSPYNLLFSCWSVFSICHDTAILNVDVYSCALCVRYYDDYDGDNPCTQCPLAISLGKACDGDEDSVFYRSKKDPQVMIDALKAAREMVEKESQ